MWTVVLHQDRLFSLHTLYQHHAHSGSEHNRWNEEWTGGRFIMPAAMRNYRAWQAAYHRRERTGWHLGIDAGGSANPVGWELGKSTVASFTVDFRTNTSTPGSGGEQPKAATSLTRLPAGPTAFHSSRPFAASAAGRF